jgi:predicted NAD/FAD-dependent oxidoreductase
MAHDVCIIGAGWSGLTAASELTAAGLDVVVVEKARGPGGRCATRRQDSFAFDHGGQYFTARSASFAAQIEGWKKLGIVSAWAPEIKVFGQRPTNAGRSPAQRLVGVPGMNAVLKHLATDLNCHFGWRAGSLERRADGWLIERDAEQPRADDAEQLIKARSVLVTAPPSQSAELLRDCSDLAPCIAEVPMNPCWALMLGFERSLDSDFDAAFDNEGPLSWLSRNSSKPGRTGEAWLLHASADWSRSHLEEQPELVAERLLQAFRARVPAARQCEPVLVRAHRWRYALAPEPLEQACLSSEPERLVVAGDWCAGNRIEGAWQSGRAAAEVLLQWQHA